MRRIAVLSGKGGVGKSSVVASLAVMLAKNHSVIAVDCDTDAANLHLLLGVTEEREKQDIFASEKAVLDESKCKHCGKCREVCNFSAIEWDNEKNQPVFNRLLCEGCGACEIVCPSKAITLEKVKNAEASESMTPYGFPVISAQLEMGESGSGKVVFDIKRKAEKHEKADFMMIDCAAGIGCLVVAALRGTDEVIAVTEPTLAAFRDLERALELVNFFNLPVSLVINRYDINPEFTAKIEEKMKEKGIEVIAKIPYDKRFVESVVALKPAVVYDKELEPLFSGIINSINPRP